VQLKNLLALSDRVRIVVTEEQNPAEARVYDGRERIKTLSDLRLVQRIRLVTHRYEVSRVPLMRGCVAGVQLDRAFVLVLRACPIPFKSILDHRKRRVSFGERV